MSKVAASFIEQRTQVLAMVQFTSRHDLQVSDFQADDGSLDLLVRVISDHQGDQKFFGVGLKGTNQSLPSAEEATHHLRTRLRKKSRAIYPKYSFPTIIILFSMQEDRGYFAWQAEPIIDRSTEPRLKVCETPECAAFDRSSLEMIIHRVNEWYDRLFVMLQTN